MRLEQFSGVSEMPAAELTQRERIFRMGSDRPWNTARRICVFTCGAISMLEIIAYYCGRLGRYIAKEKVPQVQVQCRWGHYYVHPTASLCIQ